VSDLVFTEPVVVDAEHTVAGTGGEEASLFAMDIFRMSGGCLCTSAVNVCDP
jgi:hypothetical protein